MLVAYFVPKQSSPLESTDLRDYLAKTLPGYMVPGAFVQLDALPMTHNGKVNRLALPQPSASQMRRSGAVSPRDQLETTLVRIWERVLGVSPIGVEDNFFDLGGHSLLAVRLATEVEMIVGRKLPIASLFRGSTIASLASMLREGTEESPEPLLVEYQSGTPSMSPIFAIAAPGVRSIGYAMLSRHFDASRGFYKLQAQAPIVQGRPLNITELRALAKQYVAGMRAVQREGPYHLVAMCGGCQIAEQMILQLEEQGQKVAVFVIFDTWVLEHAHRRWGWHLFSYQQRLRWMKKAGVPESIAWIKRATSNRVRVWTGKAKASKPWVEAYWPEKFQAPRFRAPILLFKRPRQPYYYIDDPLLGWGSRSEGGVELHELNADHHEVLREPHVQIISKILMERLNHVKDVTTSVSSAAPANPATNAATVVASN
jgi:thioesterase domain-containing protein